MSDPGTVKIVLIEDEPVSSKLMQLELEKYGFEVLPFLAAIPAIMHVELYPVDLILTDIFMGDLDGLDVIRAIRAKNIQTPIIAMSSEPETKYLSIRDLAGVAGANFFFAKPVSYYQLIKKINYLLDPENAA